MREKISKNVKKGILSAALVDEFSEYTSQALKMTKLSGRDILRFRLSVESALCVWLDEIGEGAECSFELSKRYGKITIAVTCEGKRCNPQEGSNEEFGNLSNSSLLQSLGLTVGYSYSEGVNRISLIPGSGVVMQLMPIAIAFILGIGFALIFKTISPSIAVSFNEQLVDPVFSALMNMLRTIAGPLIFLAVLSGIYGIGDISTLGTIGKNLMGRYIMMTYVTLLVTLGILMLIVNVSMGEYNAESGAVSDIADMVLQFIPTDIVSPFLNGNMMQIITISVACGIVMLILGDRVSELSRIVDQVYSVVQLLMEAIGKMVPVFIFISMLSFVLSNNGIDAVDIIKPIAVVVGTSLIMGLVFYPVILKVRYNISLGKLMKKLLPTFLIALTTASSAAAFSVNVDTCEKELGISSNITRFGIPLGQVVYMPIAAAEYLAISMILAGSCDVDITPMWILTAVLVCGILAIATPPIPGGSLSIFTVLFTQLNIPEVALSLALGLDLLLDYVATAGDIMCLQEELVICADKTGLLDKSILQK